MSCTTGDKSCETPRRRAALAVLGLMAVIFLSLSAFSFLPSRGQRLPQDITYKGFTANQGKRVFQAYNCMDCHTIVGNGAYLGPDLTKEYRKTGPAWLEAFLPSAGGWPTRVAVRMHLDDPSDEAMTAYLDTYPGARERIERRGGQATHMPNLPFSRDEISKLIAFLEYTSAMDNEGWPPEVKTGSLERRLRLAGMAPDIRHAVVATAASGDDEPDSSAQAADDTSLSAAAHGAQLVDEYGCTACHATDTSRKVGPGWGGLYDSQVTLTDGSEVTADTAYLAESIRDPDARVVAGYPAGVMPPYAGQFDDDELNAIVAYLKSLAGRENP